MKKKENLNQKWQISFSDLLTILLCFFVALIAHGSFKEMKSGTAFAESKIVENDDIFKELLLSVNDIEKGELVELASVIKNRINLGAYAKREVRLSSCQNQDIEKAKLYLTELERQISDAKLGKCKLTFVLGSSDCKKDGLEKEVVAKVNFSLKN